MAQVAQAQPPVEPVQPAPVVETPVAPEVSLASTSTDLPLIAEPPVQSVPAQEQPPLPVEQEAPVQEQPVAASPVPSTKVIDR